LTTEHLWIRGLFTGSDYILTGEELIEIKLVSTAMMVLIIVTIVVASLLLLGKLAVFAFFVPVAVAPPILELLAHQRRKQLFKRQESTLLGATTRKIRLGTINQLTFEGGMFTASITGRNRKFKGNVRYSDAIKIAKYVHWKKRETRIVVRRINWIFAFASFLVSALWYFLIGVVPVWVIESLIVLSIALIAIFFINLLRVKPLILD
jgi:hypothetical protein